MTTTNRQRKREERQRNRERRREARKQVERKKTRYARRAFDERDAKAARLPLLLPPQPAANPGLIASVVTLAIAAAVELEGKK